MNSQALCLRIFFYATLSFPMTPIVSASETAPPITVWRSLAVLLLARTVLDTGFRAVYTFLPFIAISLGVPVSAAAQVIQVRNLTGFFSPLFGPLSDRYGRRVMMLTGLAIAGVMGVSLYFVSSLWMAILVFTLAGFSTTLYIPAQQAFLGDNVPYRQRGRVMAIAEIAWSAAAIIGLPLVGILVQTQGWRFGFAAVGVFALFAVALLWFALPHEKRNPEHMARAISGSYVEALRAPMALAVITTMFLLAATNENINIVYAAWMNTNFGWDAAALGIVGLAIGGAELTGQLLVAFFVDRLGKWKMVGGGLALGAITYLLLPFLGTNPILGTAGVVLTFFMFELTIVAALPLITEIAPNARATLLSLGVAGFSMGRAVGSFSGPTLYDHFGFGATSFVSAAGILIACAIWFLFVREKHSGVAAA